MKVTDTCSPEAFALKATCLLHTELLDDQGFAGYDGTKEAFDRLYSELFVIARDEVSLEVEAVSQVIDTFFDYQLEIRRGQREVDWYL
jgi:hypothetical protein